jgi:putative salt-induced outer membrane protein YdiY
VVTVLILVASSCILRADTIYLLGGEKLVGTILSDEKTKVIIKSQSLGRIEVPRERIERIEHKPASSLPPVTAPPVTSPTVTLPPVSTPPVAPSPVSTLPSLTGKGPAAPTNAPVSAAATNDAARVTRKSWFKASPDRTTNDWIQLKSGEWLRGRLYGMQNRKLEFESVELDELEFDWKDVHQVVSPEALVSYGDRQAAWGSVRVDREAVTVTGIEKVSFPRYDLVGIAPGSPRELDYWSGRLALGMNLRSGNTEQADLVTKARLERRTPSTHLRLEYVGNYSETDNKQTVNNQRATEVFDIFLTRRFFLRVPFMEFYQDPFQNIDTRVTVGGGLGYYLIDKPKVEWLVFGGPGYQFVRFDTVEAGEASKRSTPALVFQSSMEIELTKRVDLDLTYEAIAANVNAGGITQHGGITIEIDLTRRLDLDISFIWDRITNPQADSNGVTPEQNDFRLNFSLGVKF